jgi:predicted subunit of tRNA(5-methylaminomethyl-2-thiouridylate) methyltransferase
LYTVVVIMSNLQVCTHCVLSNSFPRLTFDNQGVCSICREYDKWMSEWKSNLPEQRKILDKICAKAKSKRKEFDALIPYSGGKDSSFVLYVAKKELGLTCLAYTLDTGYLSEQAKNNIEKTCRKLKVEQIYYRINADLMNRLFALFVRKTGYPCSACMRAIGMGVYKLADLYDIPLVIGGTSSRTELPLSREMAEHGSLSHVRGVLKGEPIAAESRRMLCDMSMRRKIGMMLFRLSGRKRLITHAWFSLPDYMDWNYNIILETIQRELEWASPEETEHMDCIIHPIQKYIQIRRFPELDLDRLRFARLIMAGQMTREDALRRLEKPTEQCPESVLNLFLKNIKMSKNEFDKYIDLGPRHLQYDSPTMMEKIIRIVFPRRRAARY